MSNSHAAMRQAAEWFALLRSGEASDSDRHAWQAWLDQTHEHRDAWAHAETVARRFEPVRSPELRHAAADTLHGARAKSLSRRRVLGAIAILGGGALLGVEAWRAHPVYLLAQYHTGTGELRSLTLADGSSVWLNTASAFDTDYSASLRRLRLLDGEMLVDTAHDSTRPLVVDTAHGRLRALGTRFTVRLVDGATYLAVYGGAVEVRSSGGATRIVKAGSQVTFSAAVIGKTEAADPAREAWSRGVLLADNMTLQDVVAELKRYHRGHIGVAPEVAQLRVLGGYPLHDLDKTLRMLAAVLPLRVRRPLPWWTTLEKM
ncbi:FecR domain-containing protein [Janthinobacterium sp. PSPC3-1]|uniref:FecR domain-containing protein n=1 Tax=Janthinobacterium sp. PSPC3-1 TaxID=2804653 RepID=UPI003CE9BAE1